MFNVMGVMMKIVEMQATQATQIFEITFIYVLATGQRIDWVSSGRMPKNVIVAGPTFNGKYQLS